MRRFLTILVLLPFMAMVSATIAAENTGADERLEDLIAEYWDFYLENDPVAATAVGVNDFNDRLPAVTPADQAQATAVFRAYLNRARDLDPSDLSASNRINLELLIWQLQEAVRGAELDLARIPFNTFSGFFMRALTASSSVSMENRQDYEDYLARLGEVPRYFDENMDNMRRGSDEGFVLPQIVIDGVLPTIQAQVKDQAEDSSFYEPFEKMSDRLTAAEQAELREAGIAVIGDEVMPAFAALASFLAGEYEASEALAAEQLPQGEDYYAFQIRRYTTLTDVSADEIHAIGLSEVARIREEMHAIIEELEFDGDLPDFTDYLLNDPQFFAETEEELLQIVALTAKRIDYLMPGYFGKLARQSYGVVPVPAEFAPNYTTGAYYGAPKGAKNGGAFWVNTYALDQRPLYEVPALTLHEAVPGHHHQNALALELDDVPAFRRSLGFSAFGEGWALYAEKLGVEMGIYKTPYEHFGRLSYEMWRACRLVIDTGIHSQGWSRQQAIDFLTSNTALSAANARTEIDRYISWPAQALSYKLGELRIWELRKRAQTALGDAFDLREFHDAVLSQGELPLSMLDTVVDRYIQAAGE